MNISKPTLRACLREFTEFTKWRWKIIFRLIWWWWATLLNSETKTTSQESTTSKDLELLERWIRKVHVQRQLWKTWTFLVIRTGNRKSTWHLTTRSRSDKLLRKILSFSKRLASWTTLCWWELKSILNRCRELQAPTFESQCSPLMRTLQIITTRWTKWTETAIVTIQRMAVKFTTFPSSTTCSNGRWTRRPSVSWKQKYSARAPHTCQHASLAFTARGS